MPPLASRWRRLKMLKEFRGLAEADKVCYRYHDTPVSMVLQLPHGQDGSVFICSLQEPSVYVRTRKC